MNATPDPKPVPSDVDHARAEQLIAAVNEAIQTPTSYRDFSPVPVVGTAAPVAQPGRPPMSQTATDASALMLSAGVASLPIGAAASLVLWASGHADPVVIACICAAPTTLVFALSRLMKRVKEAAPDVHHHHYKGNVHQDYRTVNTQTRGVWARTQNELSD